MSPSTITPHVIDIEQESLLPLNDPGVLRHPAIRGRSGKAHVAKVYRLKDNGSASTWGPRILLPVVKVTGGLATSREAIVAYADALNAPPDEATGRAGIAGIEAAEAELDAAGI
ncbi:MAG: hypothetical protein AAF561_00380 [Planctomycetota bacterium]